MTISNSTGRCSGKTCERHTNNASHAFARSIRTSSKLVITTTHDARGYLPHLKRCWDDAFEVASNGCGLYPKMARQLNLIWKPLEKVGGDISRAKRRSIKQRTWKDNNFDPKKLKVCAGQPGDMVLLQTFYPATAILTTFLPVKTVSMNGQTVHMVVSSAGFMNEQYTANGKKQPGCGGP